MTEKCHKDYWGWDSTLRNGWGDYVEKHCPKETDDHCETHCPENKDDMEEDDPTMDWDTMEAEWSLKCRYCEKYCGEVTKYYEEIEQ